MIILDLPRSCWGESHEDKAADGEHTVCTDRRPRTPQSCQGGSKNRQDVWDADLRVGKRQGGGKETVNFDCTYQIILVNMWMSFMGNPQASPHLTRALLRFPITQLL